MNRGKALQRAPVPWTGMAEALFFWVSLTTSLGSLWFLLS